MTLLYLTLLYLLGIILSKLAWDAGWIGCTFPSWLWLLPLGGLPLTPLLNRLPCCTPPTAASLRWPVSAGFIPPRQYPSPGLIIACLLCLLLGFVRAAGQPLTPCWKPSDLAFYNLPTARAFDRTAPEAVITGYISSYPLVKDTDQRIHVVATHITVAGKEQPVTGELRLSTGLRRRYAYGQPVRLQGRLVTPPDFPDFSYRAYLARKGIHSLLYGARIDLLPAPLTGNPLLRGLYAVRARGEGLLNRLLPEPYAALANGMLLGIEAGIPDELYEQFNLTGSSHTIVISGSNVAIIAGVLLALGQRLGRRQATWLTLAGLGCYALLVGGDPAVLRATLMGGLYVVAIALRRRSTAIVSLAFACWAMTLLNAQTVWDVGFQLSSAATAGLILLTPGITAAFTRIWPRIQGGQPAAAGGIVESTRGILTGLMQDGLLVTIAANVTTLPLVLYYFGRLSLVSLATNLAIAPVQPLIMLWGSAGLLIGVSGLPWVAWLCLLVPWLSLFWTVTVVRWTAALPGASLTIEGYNLWALSLTYLLIAVSYWHTVLRQWVQQGMTQLRRHWQAYVLGPSAAGILSVGCLLLWLGALSQPDGRLHIYFLDIGQGDGILIQTPSGRQVLIDGGASPQQLFSELGAVMPFWDRSLDVVLMTHPDLDHMGAQVFVPDRYTISLAIETAASQANPDAAQWRQQMATNGVPVQRQHSGGWLDLGDGVALWVLWPTAAGYMGENADNENSLVTKLVYGDFTLLLTGDAGVPSERVLIAAGAPVAATVLKVGHHGSKGSTSTAFVEAVNPAIAVIQVGADNDYGHPHPDILARLAGQDILRNDLQGRIHLSSDGHQMWVETKRP
ncbi:MAG: DNA internalization-related competence protein ComEC/Rec2 [Caldilineaceae bacterium]